MAGRNTPRPRPPLPPPLRPARVVPGLVAGVAGTGLLYRAATGAGVWHLFAGAALFAVGLALAGYPFVLATTWRHRSRTLAAHRLRSEGTGGDRTV